MKAFWIWISLSLVGLFSASFTEAHASPQHNSFNQYLHSAYRYPNQLQAAMIWRINNTHINLASHPFALRKQGWHPSVIAVISHPNFFSYAYNQPQFRKYAPRVRKSESWNNRRFSTQPWGNVDNRFNKRTRSVRRNYCR